MHFNDHHKLGFLKQVTFLLKKYFALILFIYALIYTVIFQLYKEKDNPPYLRYILQFQTLHFLFYHTITITVTIVTAIRRCA